ncbi:MAG TPA: FGGY family carbohydrate kinase, partial [Deltaproteobacteria bacterium]|nr:FGGY family carbohydrate kinase [Deltaproteobacteria bacterium]
MTEKNYVIAVDSGTQSIRAVLFDAQGNELAIEQAQYDPYFSLQPGWAEQRTEDYWSKFCLVTKGLMAKISIDPEAIAGLGITTQRNTVIPMDKDGNALRPAIVWLDQRTVAQLPPLGLAGKMLFFFFQAEDGIRDAQKHSKFLWIQQNEP